MQDDRMLQSPLLVVLVKKLMINPKSLLDATRHAAHLLQDYFPELRCQLRLTLRFR